MATHQARGGAICPPLTEMGTERVATASYNVKGAGSFTHWPRSRAVGDAARNNFCQGIFRCPGPAPTLLSRRAARLFS